MVQKKFKITISQILCSILIIGVWATIDFVEKFDDKGRWIDSKAKSDYGVMDISSGKFSGDATINKGLKTTQDAKNYATCAPIGTVTNKGKELVMAFSVKHEQDLDCGGGYLKLVAETEPTEFSGESQYVYMIGPDKCGSSKRVHIIINYKGTNRLWKKEPTYPDDLLTHVYTVVISPNNTYKLFIDKELKEEGSLEEDWDMLPPKKIDDPTDKKPSDWVDEPTIEDATDVKPKDWGSAEERVVDKDAKKPDDWDDAEDGEWEPPLVPNPEYKGEWKARRVANPNYKGEWKARQINNPEYAADSELYLLRKPLKYVCIDIWQVKSGSIYDNIIIGDDLNEVNAIIDATWGATKDAEKKAEEDMKTTAASTTSTTEENDEL